MAIDGAPPSMRLGLLLAAELGLGGIFAVGENASLRELLVGLLLAMPVCSVGVHELFRLQNKPVFRHRLRYCLALTCMLGGVLVPAGWTNVDETEAGTATFVTIATALAMLWFVWFCTSPRRGRGLLMRFTIRDSERCARTAG